MKICKPGKLVKLQNFSIQISDGYCKRPSACLCVNLRHLQCMPHIITTILQFPIRRGFLPSGIFVVQLIIDDQINLIKLV